MPIRSFIALEIPKLPLQDIIDFRNKILGENFRAKWEPVDKLHLTIKFLGETNENLIDSISELLESACLKYKPFELSFEKFGIFKKGNDPKILWIGLFQNNSLKNFADEINDGTVKLGFEEEKRGFKPHITLLRFRGYEDSEKVLSLAKVILPEIKFTADKVIFFESKLLPSGSIYKPIKSFILKN